MLGQQYVLWIYFGSKHYPFIHKKLVFLNANFIKLIEVNDISPLSYTSYFLFDFYYINKRFCKSSNIAWRFVLIFTKPISGTPTKKLIASLNILGTLFATFVGILYAKWRRIYTNLFLQSFLVMFIVTMRDRREVT